MSQDSKQLLGPTVKERLIAGKALRESGPRSSHANWVRPADRPDPIELLKNADRGRLPELLPIRYARMRQSPFAFFRGAGVVPAADLAGTPKTGIRVQACGDCQVSNLFRQFRVYAIGRKIKTEIPASPSKNRIIVYGQTNYRCEKKTSKIGLCGKEHQKISDP